MPIDPHLATLAVATLAAGWLMAQAGLQKGALERRKRRRNCPRADGSCRRASAPAAPPDGSALLLRLRLRLALERLRDLRRRVAAAPDRPRRPRRGRRAARSSRAAASRSGDRRSRAGARRRSRRRSRGCAGATAPVDRARMVARHQLERDQRGAAGRRALVVEAAAQELLLLTPAKLPDRAERDRPLAEVGAARRGLEIVGPFRAELGELPLGALLRERVGLGGCFLQRHREDFTYSPTVRVIEKLRQERAA